MRLGALAPMPAVPPASARTSGPGAGGCRPRGGSLAALFRFGLGRNAEETTIRPLSAASAEGLRLPLLSRLSALSLAEKIRGSPGLAYIAEGSNQYAVGGHWRRRPDIGELVEISRGPHRRRLLRRLLQAFDEQGVALVVVDHDENVNEGPFYDSEGFRRVDRIVEYELALRPGYRWPDDPSIVAYEPALRDEVFAVEAESFPWMWRNSLGEMLAYESTPGVELYVLREHDRTVGYAGLTVRGHHAHLDRLAVRRSDEGRGLGTRLTTHVLRRAEALGVRRVTLSTQIDNQRSQALYQRFGFRQGRWSYDIRGIWLKQPVEARS